jgi:hypothetical protein
MSATKEIVILLVVIAWLVMLSWNQWSLQLKIRKISGITSRILEIVIGLRR